MKIFGKKTRIALLFCFTLITAAATASQRLTLFGHETNDLYRLFSANGIEVAAFGSLDKAIESAPKGSGLIITAPGYPKQRLEITPAQYKKIAARKLRTYIEYPAHIPGRQLPDSCYVGVFDRGVVTSDVFGGELPNMAVMTVNGCHVIPLGIENPLMVYAKVAGFDRAEYGLTDTKVNPLLYMHDANTMIALSALSGYKTGRFGPNLSWKAVWEYVGGWLTGQKMEFTYWESDPRPMYGRDETLPGNARVTAVDKGAEWLYKGKFFIHPSWKNRWIEMQGDGITPTGPPIPRDYLVGDGSFGIIEGHTSYIYYDGTQQYRYWRRCDVQGEVSYLLAAAENITGKGKYSASAEKLMDAMFYEAPYRQGSRNDKNSPMYGLLGWADSLNWVVYSDDNARAILGAIGASAMMGNERWNRQIVENIVANFRTASKQGFHGERLHEEDIIKNGWKYYHQRDLINLSNHFESYCWALYLWLYDKTGYEPLLEKAKTAIRLTMEGYPDKWAVAQGIQKERARAILPLSWLVRVEDTPEHRAWLDTIVQDILKEQDESGAFIENLGSDGGGWFGRTKSNAAYGSRESTLNFNNGDKVSDMLYTCNFLFLGLNEAVYATGNQQYRDALDRLGDFLLRIQVSSENHPDLDGAWFRAFDFGRWDYWAENADNGWGAWCTLTGWIQSWIVGTHALMEKDASLWDISKELNVAEDMRESLWMLEE